MLMITKERLFSLYTLSQTAQDHDIYTNSSYIYHKSTKDRANEITQQDAVNSLKFKLVNYISIDVSLRNTLSPINSPL